VDNLTHSLFALTLAQTPLRRAGRGTAWTLVVASNVPDSDIVAAVAGGGEAYLSVHRGTSHGPVGALALGLVAAGLAYAGLRWRRWRRPPPAPGADPGDASFPALAGLALLGTLSHVLMDLPTSYGTRLLSPIDWTWYAVDVMPIIDVYLWALLVSGLVAVRLAPRRRAAVAAVVLLLMLGYYGARFTLHERALEAASPPGSPAPATLSAWPDAPTPKLPGDFPCDAGTCDLGTAALPTFGSPFRWRIVRRFSNGYQVGDLDLRDAAERRVEWIPHETGAALDAGRRAPVTRAFLAFSRFPAAQIERDGADTVVRMQDVRFLDRPVPERGEEFRPGGLFSVFLRVDPSGRILDDRFGN